MSDREVRSYSDLHPHTSYSRETSGELTPYGGVLIHAYPPLSPLEVTMTTAKRLSLVAEEGGGGNVFLPIGDLLTPRGAWELLDEIRRVRKPEEAAALASRIIPSFEHAVSYRDPFLSRKRKVHLYIINVAPETYERIMRCDGELEKVVRTCDECGTFFFLAHPLVSINRIPFTREQFEHLLKIIAEARSEPGLPVGIEVRSGKTTARLAVVTEQVLDAIERQSMLRFVRVGGSDAYDDSVGRTYTSAPLSESVEELIHKLRNGIDIRPAGKHGTRAEFEKRVSGLAETKIPAELRRGLEDFSTARLPGFLRGVVDYLCRFATTFPIFCRFALEDEQIRIMNEEYGLAAQGDERALTAPQAAAVSDAGEPVHPWVGGAPHRARQEARKARPGILFLADTPTETEPLYGQQTRRHFSGVKSLLDELKKYARESDTPIMIGQPSHEPMCGPYEIVRQENLTLVRFRPSVELFFGDCLTDLPVELSVDFGLALTRAEILERSRLRMLLQRRHRKVRPFSPAHKILRELVDAREIGPFKAVVSIDCGPYAKLAFAEGRGNLDVPTFGIYTTNLADSTLHRVEAVYKKLARDLTRQPLAEPLSGHANEVLRHLLVPVATFVSRMQTEFLSAVDLLFAPPGNVEDLRKKGITSEIRDLGRGLNKEFFRPGDKGPRETIRLVCAGRFYAENRPGELVAIIERIPAEMREKVFLDVVGHGDELPAIEARLRSLLGTNVVFHGALPQRKVGEIMGRDDVSIIMGDYHTYGQVYREGMACGTIQIARDCFAARGVIADYRTAAANETGILYRECDEAAREIVNFLKNAELRRTLQANCMEGAKGFPSWREVFETQLFGPMEEIVRQYRRRHTLAGVIKRAVRRGK
jgi:hypothetical protein